jgi:predicted RecB family nuclease
MTRRLKELAGRYSEHAIATTSVLGNLIDLKDVVKDSLILPVTKFSIKEVGPYFGFAWPADDAGGANSEAWYE